VPASDHGWMQMHLRAAGRVALLAFLMLVLVSSILLVSGHRAGDGSHQALALSAGGGVQGEASLLSRMLRAPGFATRAESLERLGMGDSRLDVAPVAGAPGIAAKPGSWAAMGEGPGRAAAARLQAMKVQMQVRAPAGRPRLGVSRVLLLRFATASCSLCMPMLGRKMLQIQRQPRGYWSICWALPTRQCSLPCPRSCKIWWCRLRCTRSRAPTRSKRAKGSWRQGRKGRYRPRNWRRLLVEWGEAGHF